MNAARGLVAAFVRNDTEACCNAFSEDAGFAVPDCSSSPAQVSRHGNVAILIHDVATRLRIQGEESLNLERAPRVFRQHPEQGRWLACHAQLSARPEQLPTP